MYTYGWFTSLYDRNWRSSAKQLYRVLEFIMTSRGHSGQEHICQCRRRKRHAFDPWVRKTPWRRIWQPTQVFLPVKSDSQRTLAGYSPWGHRVRHDWATECAHTHTHTELLIGFMLADLGESVGKQGFALDWILWWSRVNSVTVNIKRSYLHDRKNEIRHSYPSQS